MRENARQAIASELRQLRKEPGPLDAAKLTHARAIVRGFGGGDASVALTRLVGLANEYRDDREIDAAISVLGEGLSSSSLLDRLSEYAEANFIDSRTARRWSDAGIDKLARLVLGQAPWIQPLIRQILVVEGDRLSVALDLRVPPGLRMDTPQLLVAEQEIDLRMPAVMRVDHEQRLASGMAELATLRDLPLKMRLDWFGEKQPTYDAVTHGTKDVIFSSRVRFLSLVTTITAPSANDHIQRKGPDFLDQ